MKIPFVDLRAQYARHKSEIDSAIQSVIDATSFIGGAPVRDFERAYAQAYGAAHCIGCGNGTDAIYVLLRMLGIGEGDEVITSAHSWIATSETISQAGATPVFVDVDDYYCLDTSLLEAAITKRTRAIIPVHLYGQAAAVDVMEELCRARNLLLIEDCAQAHFAERSGRRVGLFGAAATFSFYPGKNLGAYGDAGAIITGDAELAKRCRRYANHGALVKHQHEVEGINSRLDSMQAAILSAKLPHLPSWTAARQRIAKQYDRLLADVPEVSVPLVRPGSTHVYHLYVIQCDRRDELRAHLAENGVDTQVHYPTALPLMPAYSRLGVRPSDIPRAARNQQRILSLPIYPEMTEEMVGYVVDSVRAFFNTRSPGR